jgi:hypothetical protein
MKHFAAARHELNEMAQRPDLNHDEPAILSANAERFAKP